LILPDVNVLVYAFRKDAPDHDQFRTWLESTINSETSYGLSDLVLSGFIRIVTHPRIFRLPSSIDDAMGFVTQLRDTPTRIAIAPGPSHWKIFTRLCNDANAKGNLAPDAYLAALAIESGCEWITTDRDYSRFPGLNWRHPFAT
jgi:uncharacterized protein